MTGTVLGGAPPADSAKYKPDQSLFAGSSGVPGRGTCRRRREDTSLRLLTRRATARLGREVDQQVHVVVLAVERGRLRAEVGADFPHDLLHSGQEPVGEHLMLDVATAPV
ncbi:hypothetical protein Aca07nite_38380 [Actinoplanes capillaceus]|uniref:Uncharacterized protein n=1 Tax=Actinoplanes campanulatus TaxID=113559 RepID=A0ABQ3WJY6_9ACTN|nr:hypothetical protein Aca07nite_38380 [Actinoplanes capillaceus]